MNISEGPWVVAPYQPDLGCSLAIQDANSDVIAIIPPVNPGKAKDWRTSKRAPHDYDNAAVLAVVPEMWKLVERLLEWNEERGVAVIHFASEVGPGITFWKYLDNIRTKVEEERSLPARIKKKK